MAPHFFQATVTLSPLVVALASITTLALPAPGATPQAQVADDVWHGCRQATPAAGRHAPVRGERTQWPAWRRDAEAATEQCLRDRLAPAATARRLRGAAASG